MDRLDVEIIRLLHYAPWEFSGASESDILKRRPSIYWIYNTIAEEIKTGKLQIEHNGISKSYIIGRIQKVGNSLTVRANIDGRALELEEFRVMVYGSPSSLDGISFEDSCFASVNTVHRGLFMDGKGNFTSAASIEFFQKDQKEMEAHLSRVREHHPELGIALYGRKFPPPSESMKERYRKLRSYDGKLRKGVRTVLSEIIKDPTSRINTISTNTGLSRAHVKKFFLEIARSGMITMEPTQINSLVFDSTIVVLLVKCPFQEKNGVNRRLLSETVLGERMILERESEEDTLVYLAWSTGYPDMYTIYNEVANLMGADKVQLAVQAKTYQNTQGIIRMINNS